MRTFNFVLVEKSVDLLVDNLLDTYREQPLVLRANFFSRTERIRYTEAANAANSRLILAAALGRTDPVMVAAQISS